MLEEHLSGKYRVIKLLNHGPYANVYHARDTRSGQSVAIKVIEDVKAKQIEKLVDIQALSRLSHRHVIHLVEAFVIATATAGRAYIVTEFAESGDLFEKITGRRRLSEDVSCHFFHQLISAVSHCHSRRVFHRDIKPENLLLDLNWSLKLTDFGLSAVAGEDTPILREPCGTAEYAAPEVLSGKGYDGAKADVWSCGVVLYVMSAGLLPFDGDVKEMWGKKQRGEFPLPKWMSPGLKWLLLRILDPNPDTRITIDEILEDGWFRKGYSKIEQMDDLDDCGSFSC